MKRVLCYGDSNTWGYTPGTAVRYAEDVRWTGVMAKELGEEYHIIEAGLNGRTTVFTDPYNSLLNGLQYLPMMLVQSKPIDMIIISLGSNDLKFTDACHSARGACKLAEICKQADDSFAGSSPVFRNGPKILLVSPIALSECHFTVKPHTEVLANAPAESLRFYEEFQYFASGVGVEVFDAASVAEPSPVDGVHMEPESHLALGKALAKKVREMLG